ncbi:secondary thiamine-phosphate synthase enzyme YjbQ [Microaerobacter geothermalis]|uniref:secondary thiamine-phosphate synthase enzyme YjbQ n=1 Tax=Microaerobacter geothermalis TaxID=674972 RepID=UPI001F0270E0|nr:secondary thiamine-phosphate synthase enzyme YjbQ [Microaerobacter geothermalis]MCF6094004.1 secondary thiamine-phosphate synthase enzyme YjbQ [Microaerobacter geothermalis]
MIHQFRIASSKRDEMIEITNQVKEIVYRVEVEEGLAIVYCPHTTAGITINENADPDVVHDLLMRWDEIFPWKHEKYRHFEGNSAAHMKASMVGSSQTVLIQKGRLLLGRWQGIYFCEFDGPRERTFFVKVMKG